MKVKRKERKEIKEGSREEKRGRKEGKRREEGRQSVSAGGTFPNTLT